MGSYTCTCPDGYELSTITNRCEDIDECVVNPGICENGICTNTEGGAYCTCPEGHRLSKDMKCIDERQDECYDNSFRGQCTSPRGIRITHKECCCSKGAAWGRYCEDCPREGTREFSLQRNLLQTIFCLKYTVAYFLIKALFSRMNFSY